MLNYANAPFQLGIGIATPPGACTCPPYKTPSRTTKDLPSSNLFRLTRLPLAPPANIPPPMDTPFIVEHRSRWAWDIYAEALYPLGYGYPLWNPNIDPTASVVDLCDVGWLKKGELMQLFNARRNADPVQHGVPPSFVPFNPPNLPASGPAQRWGPSLLCSRHTSVVDAALGASAETEDGA